LRNTPWKLLFLPPDIDHIAKDYILPVGISIFSKTENKTIGYLVAGINTGKLAHGLLQAQSECTSFAITDRDGYVIISSEPNIDTKKSIDSQLLNKNSYYNESVGNSISKLPNGVHYGNHYFSHFLNLSHYPFTILIGYDHNTYNKIKQELAPNILIYIVSGAVFISILHFLGYQVIRPIMELGKLADSISKSRKFRIPKYKATELNALAQQLSIITLMEPIHNHLNGAS